MDKMTKKVAFTMALDALTAAGKTEAAEVVQKELDRLARVAMKSRSGETKADKAKAEFRSQVLDVVCKSDVAVRATDVAKVLDVSCQKATAALTQLCKDGTLVKVPGEKRSVLFAVAGPDNTEVDTFPGAQDEVETL